MTNTSKQNYVLPIVMMFALFAMISFVTGLQNPLGVIVKDQFALDNVGSQLPTFANFLAYAFLGIPAGLLLQKIGYKKTALTAIGVGIVGVLIMFCSGLIGGTAKSTFYIYLLGAFVSGISMCMLNTVVNPMLNTLGGGGNKGNQLVQFGGSCNSIAATIAPVLGGYLMAGVVGTKTIANANVIFFLAIGIFAAALLVLSMVKIPEPRLNVVKKDATDKYSPLSFRHFILGAAAIFTYVGVEVGIPNIANLFMTAGVDEGGLAMNETIAGSVVGTYWFLMLIGRLAGGVLGAKISTKTMLIYAASLGFVFVVLAMTLTTSTNVSMPVIKSNTGVVAEAVVADAPEAMACAAQSESCEKATSCCADETECTEATACTEKTECTEATACTEKTECASNTCTDTVKATEKKAGISFGMENVPIGIMFLILCGLCTSVMWGGIFNLAVEGLGKYTEAGSGIFMVMVCGGGILPLLQGFVANHTSYMTSYVVVCIGLAYILWYAFFGCKNVNKNIPVE